MSTFPHRNDGWWQHKAKIIKNNLGIGYISTSSSMKYKIEVINNLNIYCCHHHHALSVGCCKWWLFLAAIKTQKSGQSIFWKYQANAKPRTFIAGWTLSVYHIFNGCKTSHNNSVTYFFCIGKFLIKQFKNKCFYWGSASFVHCKLQFI